MNYWDLRGAALAGGAAVLASVITVSVWFTWDSGLWLRALGSAVALFWAVVLWLFTVHLFREWWRSVRPGERGRPSVPGSE